MISAMGLLYSRISPTIFGFEANTQASNQEFVMFSIANAVIDLASSAEDSQNRVKIFSNDAVYALNDGYELDISISDGGVGPPLAGLITKIGSFTANVSAAFQGRSGTNYFGKIFNEDTFINQNDTEAFNFVSKVIYSKDVAHFSLYFRSRIEVSNQLPNGEYDITIIVVKMVRRMPSNITNFPVQTVNGDLTISHSTSGTSKSDITYTNLDGEDINIKFIEIPILFTI
jgi:hypothetical protein